MWMPMAIDTVQNMRCQRINVTSACGHTMRFANDYYGGNLFNNLITNNVCYKTTGSRMVWFNRRPLIYATGGEFWGQECWALTALLHLQPHPRPRLRPQRRRYCPSELYGLVQALCTDCCMLFKYGV